MQKELEELQPKLKVAKEENEKMMTVIEKESTEVEAQSKIVKRDEAIANEQAAESQALKDEVSDHHRLSLSPPSPPPPTPASFFVPLSPPVRK